MTAFWNVAPCSVTVAVKMEAVPTSETSVCFCETTQRYFTGDYYLHTRRRESKSSSHPAWSMLQR
jgi:hypothetical protein